MDSALVPPMPPAASKLISLTHPGTRLLTPVEVEVSIDDRLHEVTLSVTEFDSMLIAQDVRHTLPAMLGVRVQSSDPDPSARPDAEPPTPLSSVDLAADIRRKLSKPAMNSSRCGWATQCSTYITGPTQPRATCCAPCTRVASRQSGPAML